MTFKQKIERRSWVLAVDPDDWGPVVTLCDGWEFKGDPGNGARGFDNLSEAWSNTKRSDVVKVR